MGTEIERKFLVKESIIDVLKGIAPTDIMQGYLSKEANATVRIRLSGDRAFLTVKGLATGISCDEWEYEIPPTDAKTMLAKNSTGDVIVKKRYEIVHDGLTFEVDVFGGKLSGLIVAEVELPSEETVVNLPEWAGKEVSLDFRYKNAVLANSGVIPSD